MVDANTPERPSQPLGLSVASQVRPSGRARLAAAEHGKMMWVDGKAESRSGGARQSGEHLVGRLDGGLTAFANEVPMGSGRQVVLSRAMAKMGVNHHAEPLQLFQIAVHGGKVNLGCKSLHNLGQFLGAHVSA